MLIGKLGEFGLIEKFKKAIRLDSSVMKGTGDDCAVIRYTKDKYILLTCDMIVEGVDFLTKDDPYLVGRKSVSVSVSDIAACAGIPRYCLISLGLPKTTSVKFIDRLFRGMRDAANRYSINIVGGDLSESQRLTIDVSMLGMVEKNKLVLRSGAKDGDIIFVTGPLGGSRKGKHLRFTPRLKEARILVKNFKVNAMTDISDGLSQDLGHILAESRKGAVIYEDLIPLSETAKNLNDALYSGEDFELIFTVPLKEAKKILKKNPMHFRPIGEIRDKKYGLRLIDNQGRAKDIASAGGFQHFQ